MKKILENRIVIITGGATGIGFETACLLVRKNAKVVLAGRRQEKLESAVKKLGHNAIAVSCDVTDDSSVNNLIIKTLGKFGRIDILINNAGELLYKPMSECTLEETKSVMETNFFGAIRCVNATLPSMKKQGNGIIVNVASIAGRIGFSNLGYYGASKFALVGYSESLRQELKNSGVFVSVICPGTVYTPLTQKILDEARLKGKNVLPIMPEQVAQKILCAIEKKKREVFVPKSVYGLYLIHFFFPKFIEWLAGKFRAADSN